MKILTSSVGFQDADGTLLANGSIVLSLPFGMYEILSGGGQVYGNSVVLNLDATAKLIGSPQIWAGDELNGHPIHAVQLCSLPNGLGAVASAQWDISGAGPIDLSLMVNTSTSVSFPSPVLQNPTAQQNINGQTLNMEGASVGFSAAGSVIPDSFFSRLSAGIIALGSAIGNAVGTLVTAAIKQPPASSNSGFSIQDANGISHFFISNAPPYQNSFVTGNGGGVVFLGSAAKASVSDTTGQIVTSGGVAFQNTSQLLPATVTNDATGGITATSNGGKSIQWTNSGVLVVNPAALGRGAALTVGGTTTTTGGISIFVGASGAQTEVLAVDPNDGSSASLRIQSLQIRTPSSGFLNGAQVFAISNTGSIGGSSFATGIAQGSGLKHQRFGSTCTTAASTGSACSSTYTWTSAFADTSYTVVCQGEGNAGGAAALFVNSHSTTQVVVQIVSFGVAVSFGAVNCIAIHD